MKLTMMEKAIKLVEEKDVVYDSTQGNIHIFQAKPHTVGVDEGYIITGDIKEKEIEWSCSCYWAEHHDECKHILAGQIIMKRDKLRQKMVVINNE